MNRPPPPPPRVALDHCSSSAGPGPPHLRSLARAVLPTLFTWMTPAQTTILRHRLLQEGCLDAPRLVGPSYGLPQLPVLRFPHRSPRLAWLETRLSVRFPRGSSRFGGCSPGVGPGSGERREQGRAHCARCACGVISGGRSIVARGPDGSLRLPDENQGVAGGELPVYDSHEAGALTVSCEVYTATQMARMRVRERPTCPARPLRSCELQGDPPTQRPKGP